ncbi:transaldolase [Poseidonibacter ostreae]|jgi:transaldolase|uniref:Transaldolase n=1 Tax=Poseidonibacter ostreae TaxID=2654171 RepID=A0A6L4WQE4_9BACT|nr:transaldolase [Poseidonibacter ostreae]KAB7886486.1 transaldolase [Poseidonibacter ostreae]KAB7887467.1 transaldolase [Poseidonibacter ostreae]KAB7891846.1 transaldolase [Poseidonibacter ostreae]MAC82820.1 transaldolase [Arcobacter sp.]|tara:strand:- start:5523 stop:6515 length:993 start_codon:yes stop_codon:yes gene_type:complete
MSLKEDINYSLWCDFIERDFLENRFQEIIKDKTIQGATSNPAIFESSISNSVAYKQQLDMLQANNAKTIYEELALTDIKRAAELLSPLHKEDADDGFISIEVDPLLCDDAQGTIEEGLRLHSSINADNVMIKVPATDAGYIAMRELTSRGIHVNATLIFSPKQAIKCAQALNEGIIESNKDIKAVVSVFVSRFDRMCDGEFITKNLEASKLGIINATKCYHEINKFKNSNIRTLFASTGVKGNELAPSYYIDNLIFPNSVNTAPLSTIEDWLKDGVKEETEIISEEECNEYFEEIKNKKVNMEKVYTDLLTQGLDAFKVSFKDLLAKLIN